jgi:hypothetical protein
MSKEITEMLDCHISSREETLTKVGADGGLPTSRVAGEPKPLRLVLIADCRAKLVDLYCKSWGDLG